MQADRIRRPSLKRSNSKSNLAGRLGIRKQNIQGVQQGANPRRRLNRSNLTTRIARPLKRSNSRQSLARSNSRSRVPAAVQRANSVQRQRSRSRTNLAVAGAQNQPIQRARSNSRNRANQRGQQQRRQISVNNRLVVNKPRNTTTVTI